jgi:hypothetical protein
MFVMQVQTSHLVDASPQGADGLYDYHYEYDIIVFSNGGVSLVARSYTDAPHEAHFLRVECDSERRPLVEEDLKNALATEAVAYLRVQGKSEIKWLSGRDNGYEILPS